MATASHVLFSWADVEPRPELRRLEPVLDTLPDEELVAAMEAGRGLTLAVAWLAVRRLGMYLEPREEPTSEEERGKWEG